MYHSDIRDTKCKKCGKLFRKVDISILNICIYCWYDIKYGLKPKSCKTASQAGLEGMAKNVKKGVY